MSHESFLWISIAVSVIATPLGILLAWLAIEKGWFDE